MAKRDFRPQAGAGRRPPELPTLETFDGDRRAFLARLGAALGLGAVASALAGCGERTVHTGDGGVDPPHPEIAGGAPLPPTELDARAAQDAGPPMPDEGPEGGVAPAPDARVDPEPDWGGPAGVPPQPDAAVDPDWGLMGDVEQPDARVDPSPDWGVGGVAPAPDAMVDGGECPNP